VSIFCSMRSNRRAGLSEAATAAVLILVILMAAGIVVLWGGLVGRSTSEAGRAAAVTEIQRIRQDVGFVYWGPDGTIILTSRARDPVTIVKVYIDSSPRTVSWTINPGETKRFNLGVGYDPLKEVTALTDKNELIILWRVDGSSSLVAPPTPPSPPTPPMPPSPPDQPERNPPISMSCLAVRVALNCLGGDNCVQSWNLYGGAACNYTPEPQRLVASWAVSWILQPGWQYFNWMAIITQPDVTCSGNLLYQYGRIGAAGGGCYADTPPDKYATIVVIFVRTS
jgi:hypothetical protein